VAVEGEGIEELAAAIDAHRTHCEESGVLIGKQRARSAERVRDLVTRRIDAHVWEQSGGEKILEQALDRIRDGDATPYSVADEIVAAVGFDPGLVRPGKEQEEGA
jgi:LAO/AO transport system kinase